MNVTVYVGWKLWRGLHMNSMSTNIHNEHRIIWPSYDYHKVSL